VIEALAEQLGGGGRQILERPPHVGQVGRAHAGQPEAACQALEQGMAEMLLEGADLVADRGRGQVEVERGLGKAQTAGARLEGAQPVQRGQTVGHGSRPKSSWVLAS
jgi:hypothetical protein